MQLLSCHWIWTTLSPSPHTHPHIHTNTYSPYQQLASDKKSQLKGLHHKIWTMEDLFREFQAWLGATEEELGGLSPPPGRPVADSKSCRKPRWAEVEWRVVFQNLNTVWSSCFYLCQQLPQLLPPHEVTFFFFSMKLYAYSIGYIIAYAKQKCTLIIIAKYNNVYIYIYIGNK